MSTIIIRIARLLAGLLAALYVQFALAQTFPSKPVRIIVPWAAGGVVDALARTVGPAVSDSTGQPVIVENRPGGNSIIGMLACAKASPDGYTLCLTSSDSLSYNPHVYKNLPFDPENDFVPVINLLWNTNSGTLMASAKAPFNSIKELIAFAKAKPGVVNWGRRAQPAYRMYISSGSSIRPG